MKMLKAFLFAFHGIAEAMPEEHGLFVCIDKYKSIGISPDLALAECKEKIKACVTQPSASLVPGNSSGPYFSTKSQFFGVSSEYLGALIEARMGYEKDFADWTPYMEVGVGILSIDHGDTTGILSESLDSGEG